MFYLFDGLAIYVQKEHNIARAFHQNLVLHNVKILNVCFELIKRSLHFGIPPTKLKICFDFVVPMHASTPVTVDKISMLLPQTAY